MSEPDETVSDEVDVPVDDEVVYEEPEVEELRGLVPPPPGYEDLGFKWQPWGPVLVANAPGYGAHFLTAIKKRVNENESVVVVVYGPSGSGKTYFGLTAAMILDPDFDVEKQVLFTRQDLMNVISNKTKINPGQALVIDESQFSVLNRTWGVSGQTELIQHIAALRSRNFILFIIILSVEMLDKIIRIFSITHRVYMMRRGVARVYEYKMGPMRPSYPETLSHMCYMPLPDSWPECEDDLKVGHGCLSPYCLKCPHSGLVNGYWEKRDKWDQIGFKPCRRGRGIYERRKKTFLEGEAIKSVQKYDSKPKVTVETRRLALTEAAESIPLTDKNHLNLDSIMDEVEKRTGARPNTREAGSDRKWYEEKFPELIRIKREAKRKRPQPAAEVKQ